MFHTVLNYVLNIGIAVTAVLVIVGWLRNRATNTDIDKAEIAAELTAGDDLLADVLMERSRWDE